MPEKKSDPDMGGAGGRRTKGFVERKGGKVIGWISLGKDPVPARDTLPAAWSSGLTRPGGPKGEEGAVWEGYHRARPFLTLMTSTYNPSPNGVTLPHLKAIRGPEGERGEGNTG